jgi:hypothetical protein
MPSKESTYTAATVYSHLSKNQLVPSLIINRFSLLSNYGDEQQSYSSVQNTGLVPSLSFSASLSSQGSETSNSLSKAFKIPDWFLLYPS